MLIFEYYVIQLVAMIVILKGWWRLYSIW